MSHSKSKKIFIAIALGLLVGSTLYLNRKKIKNLTGQINWEHTIFSALNYAIQFNDLVNKDPKKRHFQATAQAGVGGLLGSGSLVFIFNK